LADCELTVTEVWSRFALAALGASACARGAMTTITNTTAAASAATTATSTAIPTSGPAPLRYDDPAMWLCRPDLPADACRKDLDATELRPDGSKVVVPFVPAASPNVDCFYVYPTVDVGMVPGNHDDFTDTTSMRELAHSQAARFGEVCRLYAPLYRQVTIAAYFEPHEQSEPRFALAFGDVLAAFRYYLAHADPSHKIVLLGHSQGAEMTIRLLRAVFDDDPAMRARLLVAMPLGGVADVPDDRPVGGTFAHLPLCTSADELGCVVAFRTYREGHFAFTWDGPPPKGHRTACVNPADVASNERRRLAGAVLPTRSKFRPNMPSIEGATTPFLLVRNFYSAQCVDGKNGFRYLAVEADPAPGDRRSNPIYFDEVIWRSQLGLHLLDFQLAQGDLIEMVRRKAAVRTVRPLP
jgi:hypothetical protein